MMKYIVIFCVFLSAVAGRVTNSPDRQDLNTLLSNADPLENEVFSESFPINEQIEDDIPDSIRLNPAFHLLQTFSKPKYIDASEFRNSQVDDPVDLPPALDINRQLTLISASKSFQAPEPFTPEEPAESEASLPIAAALYREDITRAVNQAGSPAVEKPEPEIAEEGDLPRVVLPLAASRLGDTADIPQVEETKENPNEEPELPSLAFQNREPLVHSLSPLGHILAGFQGEFGPFGGDRLRDSFISGFRPDDF